MEDYIDTHLVEKFVGFHNPIKRNKLMRGQEGIDQFIKQCQPDKS